MSYLDRLRETKKNLERPGHPTDKTDNTPHGASFGSFVSTPTGPSQNFSGQETDVAPGRLWLIRHPDGSVRSHSFTPPASRAEVEAWYPGALAEPEDDPHGGQTTAGAS
jgi:hypothetical protein